MRTWQFLTFEEGLCVDAVCNRFYQPQEAQGGTCSACPLEAVCKELAGKQITPVERQAWEAKLVRIAEAVIDGQKEQKHPWTRRAPDGNAKKGGVRHE